MSQNPDDARQPPPGIADPVAAAPQAPDTEAVLAPRETAGGAGSAGSPDSDPRPGAALVPQGERDQLALRLQHALNNFVDSPLKAVEEADTVFDDIVTQLTSALAARRLELRASWQDTTTETTEELRLALRQYRETTEQLLHSSAPAGQ